VETAASINSSEVPFNDKNQQVHIVLWAPGAKAAIYDYLVVVVDVVVVIRSRNSRRSLIAGYQVFPVHSAAYVCTFQCCLASSQC